MTSVSAQFARKSKLSGDKEDYRVLSWSADGLDKSTFEALFRSLTAGEMPYRSGDETWVMAGGQTVGGVEYFTFVYQHWTGLYDGAVPNRRPILAQNALVMPYDNTADAASGYVDILEHLPPLSAFEQGGPPFKITLSGLDDRLAGYARIVERLSLEFVGGIAATLLEMPVVVTGAPDEMTMRERLELLDTIACLLPYGYRASLAISTASTPSTRHSVRLVFSSEPKRGQQVEATLGRNGGPGRLAEIPPGIARSYYGLLISLCEDEEHTIEEIMLHLAAQNQALTFQPEDAALALEILEQLDYPRAVHARVKAKTAPIDDVRRVFKSNGNSNSNGSSGPRKDRLLDFLRFLLNHPDTTVADVKNILGKYWKEIPFDDVRSACEWRLASDASLSRDVLLALVAQAYDNGQFADLLNSLRDYVVGRKTLELYDALSDLMLRLLTDDALPIWPLVDMKDEGVRRSKLLPQFGVVLESPDLFYNFVFKLFDKFASTVERDKLRSILDALAAASNNLLGRMHIFYAAGAFKDDAVAPSEFDQVVAAGIQYLRRLVLLAVRSSGPQPIASLLPALSCWISANSKWFGQLTKDNREILLLIPDDLYKVLALHTIQEVPATNNSTVPASGNVRATQPIAPVLSSSKSAPGVTVPIVRNPGASPTAVAKHLNAKDITPELTAFLDIIILLLEENWSSRYSLNLKYFLAGSAAQTKPYTVAGSTGTTIPPHLRAYLDALGLVYNVQGMPDYSRSYLVDRVVRAVLSYTVPSGVLNSLWLLDRIDALRGKSAILSKEGVDVIYQAALKILINFDLPPDSTLADEWIARLEKSDPVTRLELMMLKLKREAKRQPKPDIVKVAATLADIMVAAEKHRATSASNPSSRHGATGDVEAQALYMLQDAGYWTSGQMLAQFQKCLRSELIAKTRNFADPKASALELEKRFVRAIVGETKDGTPHRTLTVRDAYMALLKNSFVEHLELDCEILKVANPNFAEADLQRIGKAIAQLFPQGAKKGGIMDTVVDLVTKIGKR
ncbi:MAG TPA: hypothetical protein VJ183_05275 [Chloroflexia bacterium]|nr:hypothetical protein [Chloroflexia bacterium]